LARQSVAAGGSPVQTVATSPYWTSFASLTASARPRTGTETPTEDLPPATVIVLSTFESTVAA
jgi:hypothetical protein